MCRVSRFYAMPISSGRWLRTLQCITTVLLFRFAHSFCWKASLVRVDVSCYAQPTSCFNYNLLMSRRGDRPPSPPAPAVRGQRRRRTSLWAEEAQQDEDSALSIQPPARELQYSADFLMKQKLESVKAAVLCGGVGAASRLLAVGAGVVAPPFMRDALAMPQPDTSALLFGLASGSVQGALFGLTYRYVVRSDRQAAATSVAATSSRPKMDGFTTEHLGDGCVAAFALTSALGQSEMMLTTAAVAFVSVLERGGGLAEALAMGLLPAASFLPRAAGDLLLYSAAREALDRALDSGGVESFP